MIAEVELASTWRSVHSPTNPPLLTLGIFQRVHPVFIVDNLEVDAQNRGAWAIGSAARSRSKQNLLAPPVELAQHFKKMRCCSAFAFCSAGLTTRKRAADTVD